MRESGIAINTDRYPAEVHHLYIWICWGRQLLKLASSLVASLDIRISAYLP